MSDHSTSLARGSQATGKASRSASALFNYGNIAAILVPIPIGLLWVGASMIVYAMNRHHPNPMVGHYTQQAAYRFYGVTGFFVAIATFFPGDNPAYHLAAWVLAAAVIIPWSVVDLVRIRRQEWPDVEAPSQEAGQE